jgi:hypothetical protein
MPTEDAPRYEVERDRDETELLSALSNRMVALHRTQVGARAYEGPPDGHRSRRKRSLGNAVFVARNSRRGLAGWSR